jgi:hypothetical protein
MSYVCSAVRPVQRLVDAFLAALKTAVVMQRGIKPEPTQPVELKVPGDDFTRTVNMAAGTELSADQLFGLLGGEPATWLGASQQNGQWTWDLTNARLTPYAEVRTVDDYLVRLDALSHSRSSRLAPSAREPHSDLPSSAATGPPLGIIYAQESCKPSP